MESDDTPETFREVGIHLKNLKSDVKSFKEDIKADVKEVKEEIDEINNNIKKLMGVVFTALIAPIMVGIILAFIIKVQ